MPAFRALATALALAASLAPRSSAQSRESTSASRLIFTSIAAGSAHFCALDSAGDAQCWGDGEWGQLGDGLAISSPYAPVRVPHPSRRRFRQVVAGSTYSCALTDEGRAYCWGSDVSGMMVGATLRETCQGLPCATSPVAIAVERRFDSLSAGFEHMCALAEGRAYCWGRADVGQLGRSGALAACDGVACSRVPLLVSDSIRFTSITARGTHTCGIASGAILCWGDNKLGQLGSASRAAYSATPVRALGDASAMQVSAGASYSCAVTARGDVACWGTSDAGVVGASSANARETVIRSPDGDPFVRVTAGGTHSCALTSTGTAYCWGRDIGGRFVNSPGEGCGSVECSTAPVRVALAEQLGQIAAGGKSSCAVTRTGSIYCWGGQTESAISRADGALVP
jgi:alpha-tubulin suppressor-like RCC1 family protein